MSEQQKSNKRKAVSAKDDVKVFYPVTRRMIALNGNLCKQLLKSGNFFLNEQTNTLEQKLDVARDIEPVIKTATTITILDEVKTKVLETSLENIEKIVHISDIHVPSNLHEKRWKEYELVFSKLYDEVSRLCSTYKTIVVITGDLVHTKLDVQNETYILTRNFLSRLGEIVPTIVIIGNHDFLESNKQRVDSLTAVTDRIPNVYAMKETGLYEFGNILFSFASLFDMCFIKAQTAQSQNTRNLPMYALYHGNIKGAEYCNGVKCKVNTSYQTLSVSDFSGYDAVLLGHIHKHQNFTTCTGANVVYAGSLIQQNYGEPIEHHGYVLWDVGTHNYTFHEIKNQYVMITVNINMGELDDDSVLQKYHDRNLSVRCICTKTSREQFAELESHLRINYAIETLKIAKPLCVSKVSSPSRLVNTSGKSELDYECDMIQMLIKTDLTTYKTNLYEDLISLHKRIRDEVLPKKLNSDMEISPHWDVLEIEIKNISKYGNDMTNIIPFEQGVYSLSAPNMHGKTSLMYAFLIGFFGRVSGEARKFLHLGTTSGFVKITFLYNGTKYLVHRQLTKKSTDREEMTLDFYKVDISGTTIKLNQGNSTATQRDLESKIGTYENFTILHILSSRLCVPILQRTPGEKYNALAQLCQIQQYEKFKIQCSKYYADLKLKADNVNASLQLAKNLRQKGMLLLVDTELQRVKQQKDVVKKACAIISEGIVELKVRIQTIQNTIAKLSEHKNISEWKLHSEEQMCFEIDTIEQTPGLLTQIRELNDHSVTSIQCTLNILLTKAIPNEAHEPKMRQFVASYQTIESKTNMSYENLRKHENDLKHVLQGSQMENLDKTLLEQMLTNTHTKNMVELENQVTETCQVKSQLTKLSDRKEQLIGKIAIFLNKDICEKEDVTQLLEQKLVMLQTQLSRNEMYQQTQAIRNMCKNLEWKKEECDFHATNFTQNDMLQIMRLLDEIEHGGASALYSDLKNQIKTVEQYHTEYKHIQENIVSLQKQEAALQLHNRWQLVFNVEHDIRLVMEKLRYEKFVDELQTLDKIRECRQRLEVFDTKSKYDWMQNTLDLKVVKDVLEEHEKELSGKEQEAKHIHEILVNHQQQKELQDMAPIEQQHEIDQQLLLYTEYIRLMDKRCIPAQLVKNRMIEFNEKVNEIFAKHTSYYFKVNDNSLESKGSKQGLDFTITKKSTGYQLEPERLSGFESAILSLAINYSALSLSTTSQCSMLMVDESFDCIDEEKFVSELPSILETLKMFYRSVVIISHREIPPDAIDYKLKITHHGSFSEIGL